MVLDSKSGSYYGLNEVGLRIFELAQEGATVEQTVTTLLQEFDVEEERLRQDITAFLDNMINRKLIEVTTPGNE